jgi:hypothetical protein
MQIDDWFTAIDSFLHPLLPFLPPSFIIISRGWESKALVNLIVNLDVFGDLGYNLNIQFLPHMHRFPTISTLMVHSVAFLIDFWSRSVEFIRYLLKEISLMSRGRDEERNRGTEEHRNRWTDEQWKSTNKNQELSKWFWKGTKNHIVHIISYHIILSFRLDRHNINPNLQGNMFKCHGVVVVGVVVVRPIASGCRSNGNCRQQWRFQMGGSDQSIIFGSTEANRHEQRLYRLIHIR